MPDWGRPSLMSPGNGWGGDPSNRGWGGAMVKEKSQDIVGGDTWGAETTMKLWPPVGANQTTFQTPVVENARGENGGHMWHMQDGTNPWPPTRSDRRSPLRDVKSALQGVSRKVARALDRSERENLELRDRVARLEADKQKLERQVSALETEKFHLLDELSRVWIKKPNKKHQQRSSYVDEEHRGLLWECMWSSEVYRRPVLT